MIFPLDGSASLVRFTRLTGLFLLLGGMGDSIASDWPQWRGPKRDGHAPDAAHINLQNLGGLKPSWRKSIGGGFSSPVASQGKLIFLDEGEGKERAHCLEASTGKELWNQSYADVFQDEWGAGPRATPTIDGDRVYLQSCNGEIECLGLSDGHKIWGVNFEKDFGVKFLGSKAREGTASRRGNNGSPLIDGDALVTIVGAPDGGSIVAFNKLTGKVLWKAGTDEAAYSSPIAAQLAGVYQVVAFTADALVGVDRKSGETLWRVPLKTNAKRHTMTPVVFEDSVIVNSHTFGMIRFRISKAGPTFKVSEVWSNKDLKINLATPVLIDHWLFSQGPAKNYVCADAKTGELMWSQTGFGKEVTSSIAFGKNIVTFADDGQVAVLEANPAKYVELTRFQAAGKNWNHPAFADGRLFIRDYHEIIAFDLAPK